MLFSSVLASLSRAPRKLASMAFMSNGKPRISRLFRLRQSDTKGKGDSSSEKRLPGKAIVQSHEPCRPLEDDLKNIDRWDCVKERDCVKSRTESNFAL